MEAGNPETFRFWQHLANAGLIEGNYTGVAGSGGAEEAWGIDAKIDDGKPGRGRVIVRYWTECTTSTTFTELDGEYRVSVTDKNCSLHFANSF